MSALAFRLLQAPWYTTTDQIPNLDERLDDQRAFYQVVLAEGRVGAEHGQPGGPVPDWTVFLCDIEPRVEKAEECEESGCESCERDTNYNPYDRLHILPPLVIYPSRSYTSTSTSTCVFQNPGNPDDDGNEIPASPSTWTRTLALTDTLFNDARFASYTCLGLFPKQYLWFFEKVFSTLQPGPNNHFIARLFAELSVYGFIPREVVAALVQRARYGAFERVGCPDTPGDRYLPCDVEVMEGFLREMPGEGLVGLEYRGHLFRALHCLWTV
ncbi:hypothetical protein BDW74DRAFT_183127 [Aspergillus multicolor]|uniref:uncharacterized protein n=1 Tax=Aspergillus multicolor TaxID=41759 RepID=UPI003CCD220D